MFGKVKKWFNNIRFSFSILVHSVFRGMKSADDKTMGMTKEGEIAENAIEEQVQQQGVLNDLERGEVTQEVMELRDSNYRILKHANDYEYLGNGNVVAKTKSMIQDDLKVFNPENYKVLVIQDNKLVVKGLVEATRDIEKEGDTVKEDMEERYVLKIERDVFPRFLIEKYVKKIVIRKFDAFKVKVDLYCSSYARQFIPTDSLFITEMMNIYGKKIRNYDTVDINSIEFITDKAYGVDDITLYKFDSLVYESMNMYDKDFVITYSGVPVCDGLDLTEKYKTKEMDEKYATNAPKENAPVISLETAMYERDTLDTDKALELLKSLEN